MHRRTALLPIAFSFALGCAAAAEPVRIAAQRTIASELSSSAPDATLALELRLMYFSGSRWRVADIADALPRSARLLSQCGVAIVHAELDEIEAPEQYRFYFTPVSRELLRMLAPKKPAVVFVEDTRNRPAFDAEAIGLSNSATRPELANSVWVAYGTRDLAHALAHELFHVLADSGEHSREPGNLMQEETSPQNSRLSATQCEQMRRNGVASGLLAPMRSPVMK